jgi:dTDP-4-dehydrorhamnose 3,5-epimerase
MLWIPRGFAHGFRVISEAAHVLYKATDFYAPEHERTIAWNDPELKINWLIDNEPEISLIVSTKDQLGTPFAKAETFD